MSDSDIHAGPTRTGTTESINDACSRIVEDIESLRSLIVGIHGLQAIVRVEGLLRDAKRVREDIHNRMVELHAPIWIREAGGTRIEAALRDAGVRTWAQLASKTRNEISALRGIGPRRIEAVRVELYRRGLGFGMDFGSLTPD